MLHTKADTVFFAQNGSIPTGAWMVTKVDSTKYCVRPFMRYEAQAALPWVLGDTRYQEAQLLSPCLAASLNLSNPYADNPLVHGQRCMVSDTGIDWWGPRVYLEWNVTRMRHVVAEVLGDGGTQDVEEVRPLTIGEALDLATVRGGRAPGANFGIFSGCDGDLI